MFPISRHFKYNYVWVFSRILHDFVLYCNWCMVQFGQMILCFCFMHIGNSLIVNFFSYMGNVKTFQFSQLNSLKLYTCFNIKIQQFWKFCANAMRNWVFKVMVERGFIGEDLTNLSFECKLKGLIIAKKIKSNVCYWLETVQ